MAAVKLSLSLLGALALGACTVSTQPGAPSNAVASAALKASCELRVRAVAADTSALGPDVVGPAEVAAIRPATPEYDGELGMSVELSAAGQEKMLSYTRAHVGEPLATFCGAKEVSRATNHDPFAGPFRVHVGERGGT
jgi:preprotein translocase subunit SecD